MKLSTLPGRGTLFNFATVLIGSLLGLAIGKALKEASPTLGPTLEAGMGLVTTVLAIKIAMTSKNILIVAFSVALGGILGSLMAISESINVGAIHLNQIVPGDRQFAKGLVLTSVLFCVGPLTILGCLEDALERKITMLGTKSIMDGFSSVIFAAAYGSGVVVTAFVVLVLQGALTLFAPRLKGLAQNRAMLDELTGTGGVILLATGLKLLKAIDVPSETFLPALVIAPLTVWFIQKFERKNVSVTASSGDEFA